VDETESVKNPDVSYSN